MNETLNQANQRAMRVIVCDDEALGRQYLARMVESLGHTVLAEAANGMEAVQLVQQHKPDLLLLDIRMPEMDGLQCAQILADLDSPPAIIFVTAFDQHAIDAFKTEAVGYLVKPVNKDDLEKALKRVSRLNAAQLHSLQSSENGEQTRNHIAARTHKGIELVPIDKIFYFLADQKYVTVRHAGGEMLIDETLKDLEKEFERRFVRIHRNALMAKQYLEGITVITNGQYQVKFRGIDDRLLVSRRHLPDLRAIMDRI